MEMDVKGLGSRSVAATAGSPLGGPPPLPRFASSILTEGCRWQVWPPPPPSPPSLGEARPSSALSPSQARCRTRGGTSSPESERRAGARPAGLAPRGAHDPGPRGRASPRLRGSPGPGGSGRSSRPAGRGLGPGRVGRRRARAGKEAHRPLVRGFALEGKEARPAPARPGREEGAGGQRGGAAEGAGGAGTSASPPPAVPAPGSGQAPGALLRAAGHSAGLPHVKGAEVTEGGAPSLGTTGSGARRAAGPGRLTGPLLGGNGRPEAEARSGRWVPQLGAGDAARRGPERRSDKLLHSAAACNSTPGSAPGGRRGMPFV